MTHKVGIVFLLQMGRRNSEMLVRCPESHSDCRETVIQAGSLGLKALFKSLSGTAGRIHRKWSFKDTGCLAGGVWINSSLSQGTGVTRVWE